MAKSQIETKVREITASNLIQLNLKFKGTRFPNFPKSGAMSSNNYQKVVNECLKLSTYKYNDC